MERGMEGGRAHWMRVVDDSAWKVKRGLVGKRKEWQQRHIAEEEVKDKGKRVRYGR